MAPVWYGSMRIIQSEATLQRSWEQIFVSLPDGNPRRLTLVIRRNVAIEGESDVWEFLKGLITVLRNSVVRFAYK